MRAEEETRQQIEKEREAARAAIEKVNILVSFIYMLQLILYIAK